MCGLSYRGRLCGDRSRLGRARRCLRSRGRIAASEHDEEYAEIHDQEGGDGYGPPRSFGTRTADWDVGEGRTDLPLALVFAFFQSVENEAHELSACATSSGAPAGLFKVSRTICVCTPAMPSTFNR